MFSRFTQVGRLPSGGRRWVSAFVASLALALSLIVPAANVGAGYYPSNALISTYFDPRYCGNGAVSVVTDAGGALINVCTSTGQRILPIYPDFVAVPYGYNTFGYNTVGYNTYNYNTFGYNTYTPNVYGYGTYAANVGGVRRYTDNNSNCPNGDVTQTVSGFFCSLNGAPAFSVR